MKINIVKGHCEVCNKKLYIDTAIEIRGMNDELDIKEYIICSDCAEEWETKTEEEVIEILEK